VVVVGEREIPETRWGKCPPDDGWKSRTIEAFEPSQQRTSDMSNVTRHEADLMALSFLRNNGPDTIGNVQTAITEAGRRKLESAEA
jgi:hypothetical protein